MFVFYFYYFGNMDSPNWSMTPLDHKFPLLREPHNIFLIRTKDIFLFFFLIIIFMVSLDLTDEGRNNPKEGRHSIPLL